MSNDLSLLVRAMCADADAASAYAEANPSSGLDPAPAGRSRQGRAVAASVVAVLAVALCYGLASRSDRGGSAASAHATLRDEIAESPLQSDGQLVTAAIDPRRHEITVRAGLINTSPDDLDVGYPIQLRGADGGLLDVESAAFTESADNGISTEGSGPEAIPVIPAARAVRLWLRIRVDCGAHASARSTGGYPVIVVPLKGRDEPAAIRFGDLDLPSIGASELDQTFASYATFACLGH